MAIEAIKGASMSYQGGNATAEVKAEASVGEETTVNVATSNQIAKDTIRIATQNTDADRQNNPNQQAKAQNAQIKRAIEEINKRANNSEAIFGIHDATNRVTIKIVDKETKEVLKEYPPEQTLDMIAKVWEMAGLMVDEKR